MKKQLLLTKVLLIAICLMGGVSSVWGQVTTTLLEYGTDDVAWTSAGLATWTAGGSPTFDDVDNPTYVGITGGNGSYATSKTISPTSGTIINVTAVWRGRSNTGRAFTAGNGSYFRFGNIVVAQNDQDKKHGYVFTGLSGMASVTTFTAGSYRVDIASSTWLKIDMEINTATNTLTSFTIKSEDDKTTYVTRSSVALTSPNYTTVAFGYQKTGSVSTANAEQLKSIKITETTQPVSYANYTVHFVDNNGDSVKDDEVRNGEVGTTVNANSSDLITFYNGGYKYVYANDGGGVKVTNDGNAEFTVTYTKYGQYTYNVYAVNNAEPAVRISETPIATATTYEGESAALVWNKYLKINDQWYVTSETTFATTVTEAGSRNVVYKTSDIAYFFEMEGLTRSGGAYLTEENTSYSGKYRLRISKGSMHYTPALSAGVYTLNIGVANSNATSNEVYIYTRSGEGVLSDILHTHTATTGNTTINTVISVPEGYSIAFKGNEGSANNNARMDYMTLTPYKESPTISAVNYGTFSSDYALDFEHATGVCAYYASEATDGKVTMTKVSGTAAAGEGLFIEKMDGDISIPVVTSGTTLTGNKLKAGGVEAPADSYVFANQGGVLGFYKLSTATDIPAGKAYLEAGSYGSRMVIAFEDETTGISELKQSNQMNLNEAVYNLRGQRVAQPVKGLYIINGKKMLMK